MQIKKNISNITTPFNFELNKSFGVKNILPIDCNKSVEAIHLMIEYIRYCYFDGYRFKNKNQLHKYCRLLMNYENTNRPIILKTYIQKCLGLLNEIQNHSLCLKTMDICLHFQASKYESISGKANNIMTITTGQFIRGNSI